MNDIFLSYANENRDRARAIAAIFELRGWSVWWDRDIALGKPFDHVIEDELNAARCVVVLWTKESVRSRWVKTEASVAADTERLVPVLLDDAAVPLEFRRLQTALLIDWNGDVDHPEFVKLLDDITVLLGRPPAPAVTPAAARSVLRDRLVLNPTLLAVASVILIVGAFAATTVFRSGRSGEPSTPTRSAAGPPQGGGAPVAPATSPLRRDTVAIKIGDTVGEDIPVPGAGIIDRSGAQDVYAFASSAGQRVYFRMVQHAPAMSQIRWTLTDPDGMDLFSTCLGCGDPGVQSLRKAGTYTLTVGNDRDPSTGTYRLQLIDVPPADQFSLRIGDAIDENLPSAGAGSIEGSGRSDVYTFAASAGQRVYFRMIEHTAAISQLKWALTDPDGVDIFSRCLGCGDPGVQSLRKAGTYVLTVGNDRDPATGVYRLRLYDVPRPDQFSIRVGDTILEDVPGPGAGDIESPGAQDIYRFSALSGERVFFRMLRHAPSLSQMKWTLVDPDGMNVFSTCLGCGDPGMQTLRRPGPYTLSVGTTNDPSTGIYQLQLTPGGH